MTSILGKEIGNALIASTKNIHHMLVDATTLIHNFDPTVCGPSSPGVIGSFRPVLRKSFDRQISWVETRANQLPGNFRGAGSGQLPVGGVLFRSYVYVIVCPSIFT